jgi:serine/threonine protein kinase
VIAGRYSTEREIGRGGTGPVWLAHDEMLQRPVAMKRIGLLPGVDEFDRARAEREARISAQLQHHHVVQVYDVVVADDGVTHWLVMEYVDGPSLAGHVKRHGPMTPEQARPVLAKVAEALLAAHQAGIVHRDVKPSNILLDENGTAKLTDFGIARAKADPQLTQTGLLTGSPAYLAPEVAGGETGDEGCDVWALGATAFHLLSGRAPYDVDGNVLGTLYKIVHDPVPRLDDAGSLATLLAYQDGRYLIDDEITEGFEPTG